jgi:copper chaperone CopZ
LAIDYRLAVSIQIRQLEKWNLRFLIYPLKEISMEEVQVRVPAMYGDHHVLEVRHILLELPGVMDVYASSAFQTVQVKFDPALIEKEAIVGALETAGYLESMQIPTETGVPAYGNTRGDLFFRHTAAYEQTKHVVQFTQRVAFSGRPLWPCPGMGVISRDKEAQND